MKEILLFFALIIIATCCKPGKINQVKEDNKDFATFLDKYYDERMQLFPLAATNNGDNRFNNMLSVDFTDSYRIKLTDFHDEFLKDGCIPLNVLEKKMDDWALRQP